MDTQKNQSPTHNIPVTPENTVEKVTPRTQQGKVSAVTPEKTQSVPIKEEDFIPPESGEEEIDDDLLADQKEDLFWVVQKIIWEIFKIGFIVGIIGFIIWIIWTPSDSEKIEESTFTFFPAVEHATEESSFWGELFSWSEEDEAPNVEPLKIQEYGPISPKQNSIPLPVSQGSTIIDSVLWLQELYSLLNASASDLIPGSIPDIRRQTVNDLLIRIGTLIRTSETLQKRLNAEYQSFSVRSREANQNSVLNEKAFFEALNKFDGTSAEIYLNQKADAEQLVMTNSSFASGRKILLQNIAAYDKRLRNLYQNIAANKDALIYDVKVVNFPKSTLEIVLSPQEWRARQ